MTWLSTHYFWILVVTAPGGLESQQAVYPTQEQCVEAISRIQVPQEFQVECRQRVRSLYQ
jgi:hypothetical protein